MPAPGTDRRVRASHAAIFGTIRIARVRFLEMPPTGPVRASGHRRSVTVLVVVAPSEVVITTLARVR